MITIDDVLADQIKPHPEDKPTPTDLYRWHRADVMNELQTRNAALFEYYDAGYQAAMDDCPEWRQSDV